jgi:hypothetical protein
LKKDVIHLITSAAKYPAATTGKQKQNMQHLGILGDFKFLWLR